MTALGELLTPAGREALGAWLRDREELDRLVRERGQQRPPPEPPALTAIATTERTTTQ